MSEKKPSNMSNRRKSSSSTTADQATKANEASQASIVQVGGVTHVGPLSSIPVSPSSSSSHPSTVPPNPDSKPTTNSLMEREQALIDAMLLRFKNIVELAATSQDDVTAEVAAAQAFQTNVETQALIRASQDLLSLTRELKELWLFGPLRELGEGEEEGSIVEDSKKVGEMVEDLIKKRAGRE